MCRNIFAAAVLIFLLAACSLPQNGTPNPQAVSTQVTQLLTASPAIPTILAPAVPLLSPTPHPVPIIVLPSPTIASSTTPVPSPTTTLTPINTPTTSSIDPRLTLGAPSREDRMDDGAAWGVFSDEHVQIEPGSGYLSLTAIKTDGWHSWTVSNYELADFYMEVTATPENCSGGDRYGVVFRSPDASQGYLFGFTCDGKYAFYEWDGSKFNTLVDWASSDKIHSGAGQTNRLGIMARGDQFTFYANGSQIAEAQDSKYDEGVYGLFVASYQTPDFTVQIEQVDYWTLP
ncbi:MAG: hypothetical protein M1281_06605 [Chloroflexi bacterium]|nr:hypothetical protein [Chloroflexota bacterium]